VCVCVHVPADIMSNDEIGLNTRRFLLAYHHRHHHRNRRNLDTVRAEDVRSHRCVRRICHPISVSFIEKNRPDIYFIQRGLSTEITICLDGAFHDCRFCRGEFSDGVSVCSITGLEKQTLIVDSTPTPSYTGRANNRPFYQKDETGMSASLDNARSQRIDQMLTLQAHGIVDVDGDGLMMDAGTDQEGGDGMEDEDEEEEEEKKARGSRRSKGRRKGRRKRRRKGNSTWKVKRDRQKASTKALYLEAEPMESQKSLVSVEQSLKLASGRQNEEYALSVIDVTLNLRKDSTCLDYCTTLLILMGHLPITANNYQWKRKGRTRKRNRNRNRKKKNKKKKKKKKGAGEEGEEEENDEHQLSHRHIYPLYLMSPKLRIYVRCKVTSVQVAIQLGLYSLASVVRTKMRKGDSCSDTQIDSIYKFIRVCEKLMRFLLPGMHRLSNYAKQRHYSSYLYTKAKQYCIMASMCPHHRIPISFSKLCDCLNEDLQRNNESSVDDLLYTTNEEYRKRCHTSQRASPHLIYDQWPTLRQWNSIVMALLCIRHLVEISGGDDISDRKTKDPAEIVLGGLYILGTNGYAIWRPWNAYESMLPTVTLLKQPGYLLERNKLATIKDGSKSHRDGCKLINASMRYLHQKGIRPTHVMSFLQDAMMQYCFALV